MKSPIYLIALSAVLTAVSVLGADKDGDPKPEGNRDRPKPEAQEGRPDGEREKPGPRDGNPRPPMNANDKKVAKVFTTYDKDKDGAVSDEEIVGMMEGKQNSRGRREIRKAVDRADKDEDGILNFDEFKWWYQVGRLDEDARNRE